MLEIVNNSGMDLRSNLPRMLVFAKVAEQGSFSAAARELRLSRAAVSGHVAALEGELGVSLLHRTTRSVRLTEAGEELLGESQALEQQGRAALEGVAARAGRPVGVLRVTSPGGVFGERLLAPVLARLIREHDLSVDLHCADERISVVEGGFDAAVRLGMPRASDLVMRRVGRSDEIVVCAPALVEVAAAAESIGELRWVVHRALPSQFVLHGPGRRRRHVRLRDRILVNDSAAMMGMVRAGAGLAIIPRVGVEEDLRSGTLVEVFPDRRARIVDVYVLYPSRERVPVRVRLLVEGLRNALA